MQWYLDLEPAVVGVGCGPMVSLDAELWYVVEVICCCPVAQSTTCSDTWSGRNFRRAYNLNYALYVVETVNSQLWYVVEGVYWWSMDYLYVGLIHWCLLVFHEVLVCGTHSFQHWTVIDTWWKVYWCSMKYLCVGLTHSFQHWTVITSKGDSTSYSCPDSSCERKRTWLLWCGELEHNREIRIGKWLPWVKLHLWTRCKHWGPPEQLLKREVDAVQAAIPSPK